MITYDDFWNEIKCYDSFSIVHGENPYVNLLNDDEGILGYLKLKWDKKGIMVVDGLDLNQTEKKKKWMFADFKDLEQLCSSIVEWSGYYFASFCVVRKKMIK